MFAQQKSTTLFLAMVLALMAMLNVVQAWSCYCVNCGGQTCVRQDLPTQFAYNKGYNNWIETWKPDFYHVTNVNADQRQHFYELCAQNGAQGGQCY